MIFTIKFYPSQKKTCEINHAPHSWLIAVQSSLNLRLSMIKSSSLPVNSSKISTNR